MTTPAAEAGAHGRPPVTAALAAELAQQRFGLTGEITELGSQQDRNFLVDDAAGRVVLKIFNVATDASAIHDQVGAMTALAAAGVEAPSPVPAADGSLVGTVTLEGADHRVVALRFVEGEQLVDEHHLPTDVVTGLAELVARSTLALATVTPAAARTSMWDLQHGRDVVLDLSRAVPEDERERLLAVTEAAWARVEAVADRLPRQLIHGDVTDDNVVVRPDAGGRPAVVGVIDFGDVVESWRIGEVAVTVTAMLHHDLDDLGVLRAMVRVFADRLDLTADERAVLWPLVQLRAAVLVAAGRHQAAIDPENVYATTRMAHEWRCFEVAAGLDADAMAALFGDAPAAPTPVSPLLSLRAADGSLPVPVSFAPESDDVATDLLLRTDSEAAALDAALARATLVLVPQGAPRVTGARPASRPDAQLSQPLAAESVSRGGHELLTLVDATVLAVDDSTLHVAVQGEDGVEHRVEVACVQPSPDCRVGEVVPAGESLGRATPVEDVADAVPGAATSRHHLRLRVLPAGCATDLPWACADDVAPGYSALVAATDPALGLPVAAPLDEDEADAREQARRNAFLPDNTERYYRRPPQFVRGRRSHLIDSRGRAYLDLVNNVAAIGHSHPALEQAVSRALSMLNTNSRFLYRQLADFSERLLATTGSDAYDSVVLVNSGTEAVDLALRMAQVATGRRQVVTHAEGYHGWSMAADAVTTSAYDNPHALDSRPDWVSLTDVPNGYRGRYRGEDAGARYAADLGGVLDGLVSADRAPAAVIMESILGNSGGVVPAAGYSTAMQDQARRVGALTIADEVQVGYGRTGESFWAFQAEGTTPDIVVCAKAMGNGVPLGAVITRKEISDALGREGTFFSTTGGSPMACAAGLAVLDVLEREGLRENALEVGTHLRRRVEALAERHPLIARVHGRGLYQGIELVTDRETLAPAAAETAAVCEALLHRGVIDQATSERQNVLKVKPPLTLTHAEADFFVDALDDVLSRKWY
ncbi:aminotransferase class III-fold pyridoxal phosphate-dependent enzyme [Nocardioides sp. GY 10127]|uniref:aminotransferase class III-fold pyridoxal phosphate-dependent enzyme n=1 Tax=Nocardioides sp. GY 10127 TaxID=2569762 RepID=UPI0010A90CE6|nr:aminotransferase class III-fold pyridoxal phosphate-dependent enzyme [Nocardioides sp. GY 10127]TIC85634.1 aminotransferase class III-fold pyridoxal phosphate-dependent enzyme [Nocardioides sp. GY 10127]